MYDFDCSDDQPNDIHFIFLHWASVLNEIRNNATNKRNNTVSLFDSWSWICNSGACLLYTLTFALSVSFYFSLSERECVRVLCTLYNLTNIKWIVTISLELRIAIQKQKQNEFSICILYAIVLKENQVCCAMHISIWYSNCFIAFIIL